MATESSILGQCVLVGLEVYRSGLLMSQVGAHIRYLRPLEPEEMVCALTSYLVDRQLYSEQEMEELLALPLIRTQIAMASGLPQLLDFLREALENEGVRNCVQATINRGIALQ